MDSTAAIRARVPGCQVTVDPVEFRGWKYHTGVCVSVYALGSSEELGRGGRYLCNDDEPACGLTLRPNAVFRVAPRRAQPQRVYLPFGTDEAVGRTLRDKGHVTVAGLAPAGREEEEARRLACSFVSTDGTLVSVI